MTFVKKGIVIPLGSPGEADDVYAYASCVLYINDKFYCYYSAYDGSNFRIALAISDDGMNFVKKGVVIPIGGEGEVDDIHVYGPSVLLINNKFYCFYNASNGTNIRIALAISDDGMNFVKKGVVIPLGEAGKVDDIHVYGPSVLLINDKFYCYYTAYNGSNFRSCLAISDDGMNFVKKGVVIPLGGVGKVDDVRTTYPHVFYINDKFYCYYTAYDGSNFRGCLAISDDGMNFVKKGVVVPLGSAEEVDDARVLVLCVLHINNKFYCYYSAHDGANYRIALAISEDGM